MADVSETDATRLIRELAIADRAAAVARIAELRLEEQVALVCATPLAQRSEMLGLVPRPEDLIPLLPETELCFTVKAIGLHDSAWLLEYATQEQVTACIDLDIWNGTAANREELDGWLDVLASCSSESFVRSVLGLDPEIVVMYLQHRVVCIQKPDDDDSWEVPDGGHTIDGQFYVVPRRDDDDISPILAMLKSLFTTDYWVYFRMMQGIIHELDSENEEWALRWRTGRLEDLGFPPWDRAMRIYQFIGPDERTEIDEAPVLSDVGEWQPPVWLPSLPAASEREYLLFRALAGLDEPRRRAALYAFVGLANKVAVADRMPLSDAEFTPRAIEKAAKFASAGLEYLSGELERDPVDVVSSVTIERLFSVGANLDPESARPGFHESQDDERPADRSDRRASGNPEP